MSDKSAWLKKAEAAFNESTDYIDSNYRKQWEDGISHFNCEHHSASKYNSDKFKHRSKTFRPKTRAAIRNNEAAVAAALFGSMDVVSISGERDDPIVNASAEVMQEILNYRLNKSIPWFQTVIGGAQDAMTVGAVASYQYWDYQSEMETVEVQQPVIDEFGVPMLDMMGQPVMQTVEVQQKKVLVDKPCVDLLPIENVRFSPAADWRDPVNSSPYVIRMIPMFIQDIRARMENDDDKTGQAKWKKYDDDILRAAIDENFDSTRSKRDKDREDKFDSAGDTQELSDFDIVWVHENFIKQDGKDYHFYTLATEEMLTDPKPIREVYFHGERPIVVGCCVIESHQPLPSGIAQLGFKTQIELNEIANQRLDNVKLVLNKRYQVKRGKQIDVKSLMRNVPGGVTYVTDHADIQESQFADVTGSSYQEQDRINADYDELIGAFSASTISTNRQMGETVGGMNMLRSGANALTEYLLRTLVETWLEKVLRQLIKLEQAYETDQVVLNLAGEKAQLAQKYGIDQVTDELLNQELTLSVNVGMGATDPQTKLQRFLAAATTFVQLAPQAQQMGMNVDEIGKEVFGLSGYKDGSRFFSQDQQLQQMQQQMQQMQQMIQQLQGALQQKQGQEQAKMQIEGAKLQNEQMKVAGEQQKTQASNQVELIKLRHEAEQNERDRQASLIQKRMDLMNPTAGERVY